MAIYVTNKPFNRLNSIKKKSLLKYFRSRGSLQLKEYKKGGRTKQICSKYKN